MARREVRATTGALLITLAAVIGLSGCSAPLETPTVVAPSGTATSAASSATPTAATPTGTASPAALARAFARFDATNRRTAKAASTPGGRAFVDALVAAGFAKADMQVTKDRTSIGLPVPSVQFSVLWRGHCLIGQNGPRSGGYRSVTAEPVNGRCLIGTTRTIDW